MRTRSKDIGLCLTIGHRGSNWEISKEIDLYETLD